MENGIIKHASGVMSWNDEKTKLLRETICKGADGNEFSLALQVIHRTGLDPFAGQIHFIKRYNSKLGREEMKPQVGIDGFRLIAQRTEKYAGQLGPFWCGKDGIWKDVWLDSEPPAAAKVGALHANMKEPMWGIARFSTYVQYTQSGDLKGLWKKGADLMLAKCAEALALRKAFPQELSGMYTDDELSTHEEKDITPRNDVTEAQAEFERQKGINKAPAEKPPEQIAKEELAAKWKAAREKLPKDIYEYFKAKGLTVTNILKIIEDNQNDPEQLRGYMQDNPVETVSERLEDMNESMPLAPTG